MQEALHRISPGAAIDWSRELASFSSRKFSHCAMCSGQGALRVISSDIQDGHPVMLDVCGQCAPQYLRKLADVIEEDR